MTNITVERLASYSAGTEAAINQLMPELDRGFGGQVSSGQRLRAVIESPFHDQLVARHQARIVGAATMNVIIGAGRGRFGQLEDFVVSQELRGQGVAQALWQEMLSWCGDKGLAGFDLNTEAYRPDAIAFYRKMGARPIAGTQGHFTALINEMNPSPEPLEVARAYSQSDEATLQPLSGGLINRTYLFKDAGRKLVLQNLSPAFNDATIRDNMVVGEYLAGHGWQTPQTIAAKNGAYWLTDTDKRFWRAQTYLESDGILPAKLDQDVLWSAGQLLGRWHQTIALLNYRPEFKLENFHDTAYHAGRLVQLKDALPTKQLGKFADDFLEAYRDLPELPPTPGQLIHGDPQLKNILYRDGQPFTFIDLDTLMLGSSWLDIGDLLRSILETEPGADSLPAIEAYRQTCQPDTRPPEFWRTAKRAGQLIALELGMRFLNDIIDDHYFDWEPSYGSRLLHHFTKARQQWQIYEALDV